MEGDLNKMKNEGDEKNIVGQDEGVKGMDVQNGEIVDGIEKRTVEKTMEDYFLRYSMSVIIDRALPDVRDGLKHYEIGRASCRERV